MTTNAVFQGIADTLFDNVFVDFKQTNINVKQVSPSNVRGVPPNETFTPCTAFYNEYDAKEYGGVIHVGDIKMIIRYTEIQLIKEDDEVVWGTDTWNVVNASKVQNVYWKLQLRK